MSFTVRALAFVAAASRTGRSFGVGMCLKSVRTAYGLPARYPDATTGWRNAEHKHPGDTNPPAGVPVWWTGGSRGHGHVAVSTGDRHVSSIDVKRPGRFDIVPLDSITKVWGLPYAGWSEDINGTRVYSTPVPRKLPHEQPWLHGPAGRLLVGTVSDDGAALNNYLGYGGRTVTARTIEGLVRSLNANGHPAAAERCRREQSCGRGAYQLIAQLSRAQRRPYPAAVKR